MDNEAEQIPDPSTSNKPEPDATSYVSTKPKYGSADREMNPTIDQEDSKNVQEKKSNVDSLNGDKDPNEDPNISGTDTNTFAKNKQKMENTSQTAGAKQKRRNKGNQEQIPVIADINSLLAFVKQNLKDTFAEDLKGNLFFPPFFCPNNLADKAMVIQHEKETNSLGHSNNLEGMLAEQAVYYALQHILPNIYPTCVVIHGFMTNIFLPKILSFINVVPSSLPSSLEGVEQLELDFIIIVPSNIEIRIILLEIKKGAKIKQNKASKQLERGKVFLSELIKVVSSERVQIECSYFSPNEETGFDSSDPDYEKTESLEQELTKIVTGEVNSSDENYSVCNDTSVDTLSYDMKNNYEKILYALIAIDSTGKKKSDTNFDNRFVNLKMKLDKHAKLLSFSRIKISRKEACEYLCSTLHRQVYLKTFVKNAQPTENCGKPQRYLNVDEVKQQLPISPRIIQLFVDVLTEQQVEVLKHFDDYIIGITGPYGTGKTILMLMIALQEIEKIFANRSKYDKVVFLANDALLNNYIKPKVEDAIGKRNDVDNWKKVEFWDNRRVFDELQSLAQSEQKSLGAAVQTKFTNHRIFIDEISSTKETMIDLCFSTFPDDFKLILLQTLLKANDLEKAGICWCSNDQSISKLFGKVSNCHALSTPLRYATIQLQHAMRDDSKSLPDDDPYRGFKNVKSKPCLMFGNRTRLYELAKDEQNVGNMIKCLDKEIKFYTNDFVQPEDLLIIVQAPLYMFDFIKRHVQVCINGLASCREDGLRTAHTGITVVNAPPSDDSRIICGLEFKATIAVILHIYPIANFGQPLLLSRRYFAHTLITDEFERKLTDLEQLGKWFLEVCALEKQEQNSALHRSCKDLVGWPYGLGDPIIPSSKLSDIHQLTFSKAEIEAGQTKCLWFDNRDDDEPELATIPVKISIESHGPDKRGGSDIEMTMDYGLPNYSYISVNFILINRLVESAKPAHIKQTCCEINTAYKHRFFLTSKALLLHEMTAFGAYEVCFELQLTSNSTFPNYLPGHPASNARVPLSLIMAPAHPFYTLIEVYPNFTTNTPGTYSTYKLQGIFIFLRKAFQFGKPYLQGILSNFRKSTQVNVKYEDGTQALLPVKLHTHKFENICSLQKMEKVLSRNEDITFEVIYEEDHFYEYY